ncbi:hypothetical protein ACFWPX_02985 [Nocardia sp. NPDC058518]|uniref:hypothetical protein n=1 Tax=Nocardia sp. NPDC058518 TaxID=3346534 RepID=UPI003669AC07
MKADEWAAIAAVASCASAVVALSAVLVAGWFARQQVIAAGKQVDAALKQVEESRKLREEQSQPNVVIFVEKNPAVSKALELVVKNFGTTPAYNVELTFDPKPQVSPHAVGDTEIEDLWYPDEIPFLAPGQEWRTLWDLSHHRFEHASLPSRHEAKATYADSSEKGYTTNSVLDWESLRGTESIIIKTVHDIAKLTEKQNEMHKEISQHLAAFRVPNAGVWTYTSDGKEEALRRSAEAGESRDRLRRLSGRLTGDGTGQAPTPIDDQTAAPHSTESQSTEQA